MSNKTPQSLKIGVIVPEKETLDFISRLKNTHVESFTIAFSETPQTKKLSELAKHITEALADSSITVSCLAIYNKKGIENTDKSFLDWQTLVDHVHLFGANLVAGLPVAINAATIEGTLVRSKSRIKELGQLAAAKDARIAFCDSGSTGNWFCGGWNVQEGPSMLEMLFKEIDLDNVGLDLELFHQMNDTTDPLMQVRKWGRRIFHIHWKDEAIYNNLIRRRPTWEPPGDLSEQSMFGALKGKAQAIVDELQRTGYQGAVDIESEGNDFL